MPGQALVVGHSLGGAIVLASGSPQIAGRVLLSSAGLVRLLLPPAVAVAAVPWMTRPTVLGTARMLQPMVAPGGRVPEELAEWMALVARSCRSSLAPPPLPPELPAKRRSVPCLVATGRYDVFLPPRRVGPAAQRHLGAEPDVLDGPGHLLLDGAPMRASPWWLGPRARRAGMPHRLRMFPFDDLARGRDPYDAGRRDVDVEGRRGADRART